MSSRRIPDAASVTPFPSGPPGIVSGRSPTGASESPERPSRTRKGARVSRRVDRSSRPEEERFNIGAPRNTNGARHSTRRSRRDRPVLSDCNDAVPNYPPPSFQEAMESSPALLICPSTLTLVSTTLASPVATLIPSHLPHNMSSIPDQSVATSRWTPPDVNNTDPESNSDSDDSLLIIEGGSVPPDHGLPAGPELEARVRENYRSRHGVEFPGSPPNDQQQPKAHFEPRGRSQQRPPALDLTKAYDGSDNSQTSTPISPTGKRRFLSLSPLRTMFPSKGSNPADRPQTAHPTPGVSPYMQSPKGSSFFRSTTSLATASFLKLPLSSSTSKDKPEKRRFFSKNKTKVKESQSMEALDSWEEVSTSEASTPDASETQPASLMSMVAACQFTSSPPTSASPTRSVSFTYGALPADAPRPLHASLILPSQSQALASTTTLAVPQPQPQPSPQPSPQHQDPTPAPPSPPPPPPPNPANSIHPLSLLDRKVPFVQRPVKRSHIPTRPRIQVPIPVPLDPVVTTVRTRLPQNAPQSPPAVHPIIPRNSVTAQVARPSPLSLDSFSSPPVEAPPDSSFWQAVDTPLPSTPVKAAHPVPSSPVTPNGPLPQAQPHAPGPVSRSPSPVPPSAGKAPTSGVSTLVRWTPPLLEQAGVFSRAPSPFVEEPLTPTRHHYSGRPLPRPPGKQARNHIDSTFAPNEGYSETPFSSTLPPCPEGLLIDLDDDVEEARSDLDSPSFVTDLVDISSTSEATSITPINVLAPTPISPASSDITFNPSFCSTPPPSSRRGDRGMETNPRPVYSELTDLDLLASRIAEDEDRTRNGSNYDVSSSPVPPSPEASRSQGQGGRAGEAPSTKQIQRLSTQSNEGLTSGSGVHGTWESPSTVQHHHQPIQHHLPSRISWRAPGSPNISVSNLVLTQATKHDLEEDDDGSNIYTNSTIEGLPTATPSHNLDSSPYQYHAPYRQWQWQHLPARVY